MDRLIDFEINMDENSVFELDSFNDIRYLKKYLTQSDNKTKAIPYFDQMIKVVDSFFEIRAEAEALDKENNHSKARRKEKELPIYWDTINSLINPNITKDRLEPPIRLINIIAKEKFGTIEILSNQMRKILQRKREMVPINRVQQMDSACLRWLTVQPGYTTEQKAGNKQRVMSVIRVETYNTLENRVFKDFLRLCLSECRRYLEEYGETFKNSQRIIEVKRLQSLAIITLSKREMDNISRLVATPKPNYVLQNNPNYKTIWDLYKKLQRKTKLMELIWPNRQFLFIKFSVISILNYFRTFNSHIWENYNFQDPWIHLQPQDKGFLVSNYLEQDKLILSQADNLFISLSSIKDGSKLRITIQENSSIVKVFEIVFFYIPHVKEIQNYIRLDIGDSPFPSSYKRTIAIVYNEKKDVLLETQVLKTNLEIIQITCKDDIYLKIRNSFNNIFSDYIEVENV